MGSRPQKGKKRKRRKSWHRGLGEQRRFADIFGRLPFDDDTPADPAAGPHPIRRTPGKRLRGDTV